MGPSPSNCSQLIFASLLREREKRTAFRIGPIVELGFPTGEDLVVRVESLLLVNGSSDVEQIRASLKLPQGRWLIHSLPNDPPPSDSPPPTGAVSVVVHERALWNAVVLGLCNQTFYDSGRPVIWTHSRLQRRLQLFAPSRNYYDN